MLDEISRRVRHYAPAALPVAGLQPEAAVLVPLTRSSAPELILTQRSSMLSTHGGEVAFPGGRRDPEDQSLAATALREAREEIGLPDPQVELLGPLSERLSLHGIRVTPYVGLVSSGLEYRPNAAEIAAVFSVPLAFFRTDPREVTHRVERAGQVWLVPGYRYAGYWIWGLTAMMIVELVNLVYDAGIPLQAGPAGMRSS